MFSHSCLSHVRLIQLAPRKSFDIQALYKSDYYYYYYYYLGCCKLALASDLYQILLMQLLELFFNEVCEVTRLPLMLRPMCILNIIIIVIIVKPS